MDKLRVGILGLGRGYTHLKNFLELDNVEVVGASDWYDSRHERARKLIDEAGAKTLLVRELDDLLNLKVDAIVVASNGKVQVEHACQALEAGCHVLSEVPGAYTQEECMRLRATVERTGKTYMLGENTCYWDFFRYFRKWVKEDLFGPISIAEGEYIHYLPATLRLPDSRVLTPARPRQRGIPTPPQSGAQISPPFSISPTIWGLFSKCSMTDAFQCPAAAHPFGVQMRRCAPMDKSQSLKQPAAL